MVKVSERRYRCEYRDSNTVCQQRVAGNCPKCNARADGCSRTTEGVPSTFTNSANYSNRTTSRSRGTWHVCAGRMWTTRFSRRYVLQHAVQTAASGNSANTHSASAASSCRTALHGRECNSADTANATSCTYEYAEAAKSMFEPTVHQDDNPPKRILQYDVQKRRHERTSSASDPTGQYSRLVTAVRKLAAVWILAAVGCYTTIAFPYSKHLLKAWVWKTDGTAQRVL